MKRAASSIIFFLTSLAFASVFAQDDATPGSFPDPGPLMEPDPVKFTFEAPGWTVLAITLILVFLVTFIRWYRRYRANAYRREAVSEIQDLDLRTGNILPQAATTQVMILLKRVALHTYGRPTVASLHGITWFAYLESKGKDTPFTKLEQPVSETIYQEAPIEDKVLNEFKEISIRWIKTHA